MWKVLFVISALLLWAGAAFGAEQLVVKKLRNKSAFKEKNDWKISTELTADLIKALEKKGLKVVEYKDVKVYKNEPVIEGNITEFSLSQQQIDSMPLVSYKVFEAKLGIKLVLTGTATAQKYEVNSEHTEALKRLRSFLPGPDEAEIASELVIDFESRDAVKWGSDTFNKSVAGTARDKVINDLAGQIYAVVSNGR